jgi:hypothetical protein
MRYGITASSHISSPVTIPPTTSALQSSIADLIDAISEEVVYSVINATLVLNREIMNIVVGGIVIVEVKVTMEVAMVEDIIPATK